MEIVFWDSQNIVLKDYLEKGNIINEECYTALLEQLNDVINIKHSHLAKRNVLFYHD